MRTPAVLRRPEPVRSVKRSPLIESEPTLCMPVVVALPLMVVEPTLTRPLLKVMVVDVALFGNGYANDEPALGHEVRQSLERQKVSAERIDDDALPKVCNAVKVFALYVFGIVVEALTKYCAEDVEKKLFTVFQKSADVVEKKLFTLFQ